MITLCCILTNLCKKRAKRLLSSLLVNKNGAQIALSALFAWCRRRESNSHGRKAHWILSPARLPVSPLRHFNEPIIATLGLRCQCYLAERKAHGAKRLEVGGESLSALNFILQKITAKRNDSKLSCLVLNTWMRSALCALRFADYSSPFSIISMISSV